MLIVYHFKYYHIAHLQTMQKHPQTVTSEIPIHIGSSVCTHPFLASYNPTDAKLATNLTSDLTAENNNVLSCIKKEYNGPALKHLYRFVTDPDHGFTLGDPKIWDSFSILSPNEVSKYMDEYFGKMICVGNHYLGMGHVLVIDYIPATDKFIFRRDGGSNGFEAEAYYAEYTAPSYLPEKFPLFDSSTDQSKADLLLATQSANPEQCDELTILNRVQLNVQYSYNDLMKIIHPKWSD